MAGPTSFVCEVCGKTFKSALVLKSHSQSHDDKTNFTCKDCVEGFNTYGKYQFHKMKHLGEDGKKIMCEECGRKFHSKAQLKEHTFQHTGVRAFVCHICGKAYGFSTSLSRHMDIHEGKKYDCDMCGMSLTQSATLKRHKKTAHGIIAPSRHYTKTNGVT